MPWLRCLHDRGLAFQQLIVGEPLRLSWRGAFPSSGFPDGAYLPNVNANCFLLPSRARDVQARGGTALKGRALYNFCM